MADITMCTGKDCPMAKDCHRYTATPNNIRQSYFGKPPINSNKKCDYYWNNKK